MYQLPHALGRWIDTTGTEFSTYCSSDRQLVIHKDNMSLYYFTLKEGRRKTRKEMYKASEPTTGQINPNQHHRVDMDGSFATGLSRWSINNKDRFTAEVIETEQSNNNWECTYRRIRFVNMDAHQLAYLVDCLKTQQWNSKHQQTGPVRTTWEILDSPSTVTTGRPYPKQNVRKNT